MCSTFYVTDYKYKNLKKLQIETSPRIQNAVL